MALKLKLLLHDDLTLLATKKLSPKYKHCRETITETCGTSSNFVRHLEHMTRYTKTTTGHFLSRDCGLPKT